MIELNKIYNQDCLEGMKYIDDKSIDMILCDLPYGNGKTSISGIQLFLLNHFGINIEELSKTMVL